MSTRAEDERPSGSKRTSTKVIAVFLTLALIAAAGTALFTGITTYSVAQVLSDPQAYRIVIELRAPRIVFAILVGGALSVIGAAYQALFRNPLASPFSLGVSSGAALGASGALFLGRASPLGIEMSAIVGAGLSIVLILLINRSRGAAGRDSLLLVGIVFSFFCSSILTLLQYLSDYTQLFRVTRWMLGGVPAVTWQTVAVGAVLVLFTVVWLLMRARSLDLMLFGNEFAKTKGVETDKLTHQVFVVTSVAIGWMVAQCGVIGFVGIIVPAAVRLVVGLHHRRVIPLSFLGGALLVVLCDIAGRILTAPFEIPAGVFTAVLGGPVFVLLLLRSRREIL
jgi:iron complex transport system permease protein